MFKGDEHLHYMEAEDGQKYVFDEQLQAYRPADFARRYTKTRASLGEKHAGYEGKRKGLMILVDFDDAKFNRRVNQQVQN